MSFFLLLFFVFALVLVGAIDFAARRLIHAVFEAWAALFLLFYLLTSNFFLLPHDMRAESAGREAGRCVPDLHAHSSARMSSEAAYSAPRSAGLRRLDGAKEGASF